MRGLRDWSEDLAHGKSPPPTRAGSWLTREEGCARWRVVSGFTAVTSPIREFRGGTTFKNERCGSVPQTSRHLAFLTAINARVSVIPIRITHAKINSTVESCRNPVVDWAISAA